MPTYSYTIRDNKGKIHYGNMEAATPDMVRLTLQNQGFWIINIGKRKTKGEGIRRIKGRQKVNNEDLIMFAQQMAAMIEADVSILRTLEILSQQSESKLLAHATSEISTDVKAGSSLPQAMKKHPAVFSDLWIYLLEAGEASGQTPLILRQLAAYIEVRKTLEEKLLTSLLYPIILICLALAIIIVFVFKIVPIFTEMFASFGLKLPFITRLVISTSNFVKDFFWIGFLGIIGLILGWRLYIKTEKGKWMFDAFVLKLPLIGPFIYNILLERFTRNLSLMLRSAVPILSSIDTLERLFIDNKPFQRAISSVKDEVREGKPLSFSLESTGIFPTMLIQMITVGEEAGKLPEMLERVAGFYKSRLDKAVSRFSAAIEPIIIIFVGAIVAVVVFSIFLPIFQMASIGGIQ